jgi:hypothetical protein
MSKTSLGVVTAVLRLNSKESLEQQAQDHYSHRESTCNAGRVQHPLCLIPSQYRDFNLNRDVEVLWIPTL